MHDIDRTLLEAPSGEFEDEEFEFEQAHDEQFLFDEQEDEFGPEPTPGCPAHRLTGAQEAALADRLSQVRSDPELEQFLTDLFRSTADQAGRFARSRTGRQLGGLLKQTATRILPLVLGPQGATTSAEAPENPGALGVSAEAARYLGLRPEGMNAEDLEFEVARRLVQLGDCAIANALRRLNSAPPAQVARRAVVEATNRHAPGLATYHATAAAPLRRQAIARPGPALTPAGGQCTRCGNGSAPSSGRWVKRGNSVLLLSD